jgi:hypothetical protein
VVIVFDSNIWISELGLRSGAAAAVKFFLRHQGARLAIPEVVRLEVQYHLQRDLREYIEEIRTNYRQLLTAFGKLKELVLPTELDIEAKVDELFASIDVDTLDIPFSLESARSSFLKIIAKLPPSDKTQEFKDGVLWSDCVTLLNSDSVVLVSSDKAFYQNRNYSEGLARNLRDEIASRPNDLQIHPTLSELLKAIRTRVTLNEDNLADAFLQDQHESVFGMLTRHGFELGPKPSVSYELYATENPKILFLEFTITYPCTDLRGEGRHNALLQLRGDSSFEPDSGAFRHLRNFGERLRFRMPDGSEQENRNHVVFAAGITLGHKEISHKVRYKLEDEQP